MDDRSLWELVLDSWSALSERFEPEIERMSRQHGVDMNTWGLLIAVLKFEPDPTTPADLLVRSPYTAAEEYMDGLNKASSQNLLAESDPGKYCLTDQGKDIIEHLIAAARKVMVSADPLPPLDSDKLAGYLDRLVEASLKNPPPPNPWAIALSYRLMPKMKPPLPYIEQAITCLAAYRDDAHLSAWRRSGLSATALETLTYLWRGEARSLNKLCSELEYRGHPCSVYENAFDELRGLGYVDGPDNSIRVSGAGRVFRNQVEGDTDKYFFAPWSCLTEAEKAEMSGLLTRLKDGLVVVVE
jgi:hypothetical protein